MTILGLHVIDRERALFWADTEVFSGAEPAGLQCKLVVNIMAQTVAAGAGWADLAAEASRAVMAAGCFDDAADLLPDVLRKAAVRLEPRHRTRGQGAFAENVFLIAGWSRRDSRIIGYSFSAYDFFAPVVQNAFTVPAIDHDGFRPSWPADVLPIARAQIGRLQDSYPAATGGPLCVADLRPGWTIATSFPNFAGAACPVETVALGAGSAPSPALRVVDEAA